jgi:hypothetical protein
VEGCLITRAPPELVYQVCALLLPTVLGCQELPPNPSQCIAPKTHPRLPLLTIRAVHVCTAHRC